MQDLQSAMVDILRDFLAAHRELNDVFRRYREGSLRFEVVQRLVGGDPSSRLYRLKERCHQCFRQRSAGDLAAHDRGVLFDLAMGSLFHEAMKLRENLYQQEFYLPRVRTLRTDERHIGERDDETAELFEEFEKILSASAKRLDEAVEETEVLLVQTRGQLKWLLQAHKSNGLLARCLYEHEEWVDDVFPERTEGLLAFVYGETAIGYLVAAASYLQSAYFVEALAVIRGRCAEVVEHPQVRRLALYAEGMQAFLSADYPRCIEQLAEWCEAGLEGESAAHVRLATAALAKMPNLLDGEAPLLGEAKRLHELLREHAGQVG